MLQWPGDRLRNSMHGCSACKYPADRTEIYLYIYMCVCMCVFKCECEMEKAFSAKEEDKAAILVDILEE